MNLSYSNCRLCPRECGADRDNGQLGFCRATVQPRVALADLHHWEEPCLSGTRGSGTVFFSHCNLGCIFCQNAPVSSGEIGQEVSNDRLADIFLSLQAKGAHNINLVTPSHYAPDILKALDIAKSKGLRLPIVYNCGGYENLPTLTALDGYVDVFLPDLKYATAETSRGCAGIDNYFYVATKAILRMAKMIGECRFDDDGIMQRGLIVRHLVLPGRVEESKTILDWIRDELPEWVTVSLMGQYMPVSRAAGHPEFGRKLRRKEYQEVVDHLLDSGLENGYCQEWGAADKKFVPEFILKGVKTDA